MELALMAAVAENGVIGRGNKLPWHLPNDLKHFRAMTWGKPVIMGRKTWESLGRPLPGRTNIVISRQAGYAPVGARVVPTLDEAIALAESIALLDGADEAVVIGGAEIYALSLPRCDRLYLTEVHAVVEGDVYFPAYDRGPWREVDRESFAAEGPNPYPYSFVVYARR